MSLVSEIMGTAPNRVVEHSPGPNPRIGTSDWRAEMDSTRLCSQENCTLPTDARGLCAGHYRKARRSGQISTLTESERFFAKVDLASGFCWPWTARVSVDGYGQFYFRGGMVGAHRASYIMSVGEIPEGAEVDHLCRNRSCVNPDHLEVVSHAENTRRAGAAKTHCKRGHEYTKASTGIARNGRRYCKTCMNRPEPCPACGEPRSKNNMGSHLSRMHPGWGPDGF